MATFQRAQQVPDAVIRTANGPNYRHITFNGAPGSILEDPKVRQAIMKGIDRKSSRSRRSARSSGREAARQPPLRGGQEGYEDNSGVVAFDPEQAESELDAAGWTLQGNVRAKDGKQLAIRDIIPTGTPVSEAEARIVQQQLGAIGVKVTIEAVPLRQLLRAVRERRQLRYQPLRLAGHPSPISSS